MMAELVYDALTVALFRRGMPTGMIVHSDHGSQYCSHRSLAETAMCLYKQLISPTLILRDYNAQVGEALAGVKAMNKMLSLGTPSKGVGR